MRRAFAFFVLALSLPVFCADKPNAANCGVPLARMARELSSEEFLARLNAVPADPLVLKLENIKWRAIYARVRGAISRQRFNPFWVFDNAEALQAICEYFAPSDPHTSPKYAHGSSVWVDEWERFHLEHIGELSGLWKKGAPPGSTKFKRKLLVLIAIHSLLPSHSATSPPVIAGDWRSSARVQEIQAGIERDFGSDTDLFQLMFNREYRRVTGARVPHAVRASQNARDLRRDLREIGVNQEEYDAWGPRVRADFQERMRQNDIDLAVESVRSFASSTTPLIGLFLETSPGGDHSQHGTEIRILQGLVDRHGSVEKFLSTLGNALALAGLPNVHPSLGAKTRLVECLVQAVVAHLVGQGLSIEVFQKFQADDDTAPYFISMDHLLIQRTGLSLLDLKGLVARRAQP